MLGTVLIIMFTIVFVFGIAFYRARRSRPNNPESPNSRSSNGLIPLQIVQQHSRHPTTTSELRLISPRPSHQRHSRQLTSTSEIRESLNNLPVSRPERSYEVGDSLRKYLRTKSEAQHRVSTSIHSLAETDRRIRERIWATGEANIPPSPRAAYTWNRCVL